MHFLRFSLCFLLVYLQLTSAQRAVIKGTRYEPTPYYNVVPRPGSGVSVLQDARVLSNEPFIISFELPKLSGKGGLGDSRRSRFGAKRSKLQKKRNRRLRQFRHVVLPEGELLERRKRFHMLNRPSRVEGQRMSSLIMEDGRKSHNRVNYGDMKPLEKFDVGRYLNYGRNEGTTFEPKPHPPTNYFDIRNRNLLQKVFASNTPSSESEQGPQKTGESDNHRGWDKIKEKWISLFRKSKDPEDNEISKEEDVLGAKSQKIWAHCQLLKLLKAPQKNPYLYKLLPPNFPSLITDEERQLECSKIHEMADLDKDKKLIAQKIEHLEKLLTSDFNTTESGLPQWQMEVESATRRKRDIESSEAHVKSEGENTLQDESLQGKSEGEVRSDRSKRTKMQKKDAGHTRKRRDRSKEQKAEENGDKAKKKKRQQKTPRSGAESRKESDNTQRRLLKKDKRKRVTDEKDDTQEKVETRVNGGTGEGGMESQLEGKEVTSKKRLEEDDLKLKIEGDSSEIKREKQEIKSGKDNPLQDVFSQNEVSKIIKQKEREANIFDKILRAMKKYEENNPYDESFRPQKRENRNETEEVTGDLQNVNEPDSREDDANLEDAVKKLAKIFKILGVRKEAWRKSCPGCGDSEESSSEESKEDDRKEEQSTKGGRVRMGKPSGKCVCNEDCPLCSNCLKCFRECRKAAHAAKSSSHGGQGDVIAASAIDHEPQGLISAKKLEKSKDGTTLLHETHILTMSPVDSHEENLNSVNRHNVIKSERTYRSKLPPSRDLVRVYFDNPENKLLVWTKRGRRTMPWGPLTSDLQLYRDRARQILKSAEDILQRIKETEEKIQLSGQSEDDGKPTIDNSKGENNMDDIIKKVVNEDVTKKILTPWKAEMETNSDSLTKHGRTNEMEKHDENSAEEELPDASKEGSSEKVELKNNLQEDISGNVGTQVSQEDQEGTKLPNGDGGNPTVHRFGKMSPGEPEIVGQSEGSQSLESSREVSSSVQDEAESGEFQRDNATPNELNVVESSKQLPYEARNLDSGSVEAAVEPIEEQPKEEEPRGEKAENALENIIGNEETVKDKAEEARESEMFVDGGYPEEQGEYEDIPAKVEAVNDEKTGKGKDERVNQSFDEEDEDLYNANKYSTADSEETAHLRESSEARGFVEGKNPEKALNGDSLEAGSEMESGEENRSAEEVLEHLKKALNDGHLGQEKQVWDESAEEDRYNTEESSEIDEDTVEKEMPRKVLQEQKSIEDLEESPAQSKDTEDETMTSIRKVEDKEELSEEAAELSKETAEDINGQVPDNGVEAKTEEPAKEPEKGGKGNEETTEENIFEDHIKAIEDNYIIKGVKQTKEEKEAILKALLNAEGNKEVGELVNVAEDTQQDNEGQESITDGYSPLKTTVPEEPNMKDETVKLNAEVESGNPEQETIKTLIKHLETGHMDDKDFEAVKKLDESKIDHLVGEMQKDDHGSPTNCQTKMKLCQAVCGCNSTSEVDKYDIIKGFLVWIKGMQLD